MKMSDLIADMIMDMFDEGESTVQIQRNDLANRLGCVPSQINYVITSRFTPEAGYRIESRRGGGGYILITRADSKDNAIMALVNSIGDSIDERTARAHLYNLNYQKLIDDKSARLMTAAVLDSNFKGYEREHANIIRAKQLKQMLLAYID
ncbi:MAG: CtsR family transcriptional regulator [Ruminococcaceae bacterium]|jgi:transcriptional regulator CtsR|nr:CtsR family transcriptional regulator [Oscillospiraceae bacterium]